MFWAYGRAGNIFSLLGGGEVWVPRGWRAFGLSARSIISYLQMGLADTHFTVNLTPIGVETIGLGTSCYSSKAWKKMRNSATWLHPVPSAMVGWPHCSSWQAVLGLCLQFCLQILCQSPLAVPMRPFPLVTLVGRCVLWLRLSRWETVLSSALSSLGRLYVWHIPNPTSSCLAPTLQVTFPLLFCFLSPKLPTVHLC